MPFYAASDHPLIVGCWQLDDRSWKAHSETDIARAIDTYIATGVRAFDTADIYGRSELLLGQLLPPEAQVSTRASFFEAVPTPRQVRHKIDLSRRHLHRERLDAVQLYWPDAQLDIASTLEVFAALVEEGVIAQFGVTNFNLERLKQAVALAPVTFHQVQYSLVDRRVERGVQQFCQDQGIALLAYGPLAGGFLSAPFRGLAQAKPESDHARSFYYANMVETHGGWDAMQSMLEILAALAQRHNKTIAQVALNWVAHQPGVTGVVSGLTLNRGRILQNAAAFDWEMEMGALAALSEASAQIFTQPGGIYSYEGH